jgi:SAM-dependent methyltransferase
MTNNKPLIVDYVVEALLPLLEDKPLQHLDVSAGWGHLIRAIGKARPDVDSQACDYPIAPEIADILTKSANLDEGKLPYESESFDLVTCTEAFEHIENHRPIIREMFRILKPGGLVVISTPNILNFRSRLKFLFRGSYEYFDPLPTAEDLGSRRWMRHINPVTFYHLSLALVDAGFEDPRHHPGKTQKLSACFYWLVPFFRWNVASARHMRVRKRIRVTPLSEDLAAENNSWNVFASRTLIVSARKPLSRRKIMDLPPPEPVPPS